MNTPIFIACIIAAAVCLILTVIFFRPVKGFCKLLLHTVFGWIGLALYNHLGVLFSCTVGVNLASATIAGVLGIPGVLMMTALKLIYHI